MPDRSIFRLLIGISLSACVLASSAQTFYADVDLDDVRVDRALLLLAELYDVSIAAGALPETNVTVRLRDVGADDAFGALAAAADLEISRHGSVVLVSSRGAAPAAHASQLAQLPPRWPAGFEWLVAAQVVARPAGEGAVILEGPPTAVQAAAMAMEAARRGAVENRIFRLGAASGEDVLEVVEPLLEAGIEHAAYGSTEHHLTVSALPGTLEKVESLVAELVESPVLFEVEVRVVEISSSALRRMGAQGRFRLDVRGGVLATTFPLDTLDDARIYFPSPNDLATLSNLAGNNATTGTGDLGSLEDSGFRFGQVDGRGIGFLVEMLEQEGEAHVMATPRVTALDNRQARISMVDTLRIPTFTQNATFSTTTVSGIEQVDVGTTLEVRPRRAGDGAILLAVTPEVSELAPSVETFNLSGLTQGLPVVTRRRTETEVILESGETLVIGGLVRERESTRLGKTPGLGDIPVLGRAFQHRGRDTESAELLVFVTPRELPPAEVRRNKVRVDDRWIPAELAARVERARGLTAGTAAERVAGVQALSGADADLLAEGLDVGPEVIFLGRDPSLDVRVAAALFLFRLRPSSALGEVTRFDDSRGVALTALASPMAPHLRGALAELVAHSDHGAELLERRLRAAIVARDSAAAGHLCEALSMVAPVRAAELAGSLRAAAEVLPETQLLDALSGHSDNAAHLARQAAASGSAERRAFALAGLVRSLGPDGVADFLRGASALTPEASLRERVLALEPFATTRARTEPALGWSGVPAEIEVLGDASQVESVEAALALLTRKAPDLRHLVGFALARIELGGTESTVDPWRRRAMIARGETRPDHLAQRLVRLATLVFESRVRGFPASSHRSLARAVREEIRTLERLTGAPCTPEEADSTIEHILTMKDG